MKTTVGFTLTKCIAIPTGIKTNKRFAQLEKRIVLSSSKADFLCAREVASECGLGSFAAFLPSCHQCLFCIGTSLPLSRSTSGCVG